MPIDFSQDGAYGAGQENSSTGSFGTAAGSPSSSDTSTDAFPGSGFGDVGGHSATPGPSMGFFGGGGGGSSTPAPSNPYLTSAGWDTRTIPNNPYPTGGYITQASFAGGGAVPDSISANYSTDLTAAMDAVDQSLAYGRKKFGLGAGNDSTSQSAKQQTQQLAGMATIPGNQSNSGRPPIQPLPGPLPPTSNPFGQRGTRPMGQNDNDDQGQQQASNDQEQPQQQGIPDDDEETS